MAFKLPPLPFEKNALEPYISIETLEYHYGKHHQTYVNKLNALVGETDKSLEEIIRNNSGSIFNNAAQIWNHTFYWHCLSPNFDQKIPDNLLNALINTFETVEKFKQQFSQIAINTFGSGWAWLIKNPENTLEIISTSNAETPINSTATPLLTCDVWEHAYYIDTRNDRAKYVDNFWHLVNWEFVAKQLNK